MKMPTARILLGDVIERLSSLPSESVQCVVTSPPYWGLRDYGVDGQIGLERTPEEYIAKMVEVFAEVHRVLRSDGVLWLNIGDAYNAHPGKRKTTDKVGPKQESNGGSNTTGSRHVASLKPKDIVGVPWMLAFALRSFGWWLRQDVIWAKPKCMPGSQLDRCTSSHEYVFQLTKSGCYFSDFDAIKTPLRESSLVRLAQDVQAQAGSHRANGGEKTNGPMKAVRSSDKQRGHSRRHQGFNDRWDAMEKAEQGSSPAMMRDVWFIAPATFDEAHFAVMPEELARRGILSGSREGDTVLDPFTGSGTTGVMALRLGRNFVGCELNPAYAALAEKRIDSEAPLLNEVSTLQQECA